MPKRSKAQEAREPTSPANMPRDVARAVLAAVRAEPAADRIHVDAVGAQDFLGHDACPPVGCARPLRCPSGDGSEAAKDRNGSIAILRTVTVARPEPRAEPRPHVRRIKPGRSRADSNSRTAAAIPAAGSCDTAPRRRPGQHLPPRTDRRRRTGPTSPARAGTPASSAASRARSRARRLSASWIGWGPTRRNQYLALAKSPSRRCMMPCQ